MYDELLLVLGIIVLVIVATASFTYAALCRWHDH